MLKIKHLIFFCVFRNHPEKRLHPDLFLLWPNDVIKSGQDVTQLLLLCLLSGQSISELRAFIAF